MSDAMSNPIDWVQFYNPAVGGQVTPPGSSSTTTSEATVTTVTPASSSTPQGNSSAAIGPLSPEGRVLKPIRRRSRASRRTPTTLLNTDTTNFRAMVQQFTGGPSAPFTSRPQTSAPHLFFGLGSHQQPMNTAIMTIPSGYNQYRQQQQQQLQQLQQQQHYQQQQFMFPTSNNPVGDVFLPRLSNPRPNLQVSDGFFVGSGSSHVFPPRPSSSND